ncbi:MAG: DUF58 domain-containing protein [Crocinitomicaceae bacterium]|jgi:uncharacterized protein (DUF58 family)|nr:DUF58 domain-containing protein [Crocinitomicaceae bacterium]MDP4760768.1 DUF58 domain-containing protein [Crocinitomicaceae bacterium]
MNPKIDRLRLAQFGNLEVLAKQVVEGFITGLHKSPFHGFSVEFAEHRLYNPGESTRNIDWRLFGRTEKMFTKKFEEETNLRCQIVIDGSSSMFFPKGDLTKFEFSVYAAASLIELLKRQRDAVGLSLFSDKLDLHTSAKSSLTHHRFLYSELEKRMKDYEEKSRSGTDAIQALHDISELTHQRSMVVIFTDLLDDPNRIDELFRAMQHLKHNKHEVILFHVLDAKMEQNFELDNRPHQLIDMETGEKMLLQPAEVREHYVKGIEAYFNEVKMRCVNHRIDFMTANIHEGYNQVLLQYLLKRQKLF